MSRTHRLLVLGLSERVPAERLLGPGFVRTPEGWRADLPVAPACDLAARLRGVVLDGQAITLLAEPPLPRGPVREARTAEARRMREASPGFSRPGTQTDAESRVGLTPEALAFQLGRRAKGARVWDVCCGAGGNTIGFARAGCEVVAIEQEPARLAQARHNAALYGVSERVRFVLGDAVALAAPGPGELLFVDPPWGEAYREPHGVEAHGLVGALRAAWPANPMWVKLPPAFATPSLPGAWEAVFGVGAGDERRVKYWIGRLAGA